MQKVLEYIEVGKAEGAELLCGGERATKGTLAKGFFIQPTVFDRVRPDMRIAREEIFGPVLSVIRVESFEEAMAAANASDFGLTSSIYTRDAVRMFRYIEEIETGMTHVNSPTLGGEAQLPEIVRLDQHDPLDRRRGAHEISALDIGVLEVAQHSRQDVAFGRRCHDLLDQRRRHTAVEPGHLRLTFGLAPQTAAIERVDE